MEGGVTFTGNALNIPLKVSKPIHLDYHRHNITLILICPKRKTAEISVFELRNQVFSMKQLQLRALRFSFSNSFSSISSRIEFVSRNKSNS